MKKILFPTMLLASAFAVLGGMNAFHSQKDSLDASKSNSRISNNYSVKYQDCITLEDFPVGTVNAKQKQSWDLMKVNASVKKYGQSLDSTLKSLNSIDAHNFIHQEFLRSKNSLESSELSEIRKHYHCEIMRICYDSDKFLNLGSEGRL